jgi:cysteine desulfurase
MSEAERQVIGLLMSDGASEGAVADCRLLWTSGGTEANAMIIAAAAAGGKSTFMVTSAVEHPSVTLPAAAAGLDCRTLPLHLSPDGAALTDDTLSFLRTCHEEATSLLVLSVMAANNEVGWTMPLAALGQAVADLRANPACTTPILFHSDCAQLLGKLPLYLDLLPELDAVSIAGHKFGAPKGIGALVYRTRVAAHLTPLFRGGCQQGGLRAGTVPVFLSTLLGAAAGEARRKLDGNVGPASLAARRDLLLAELRTATHCPLIVRTPLAPTAGLPNTLCLTFDAPSTSLTGWGVQAGLTSAVAFSTGPACASVGSGGMAAACYPVSVSLRGIGLPSTEAARTIRLSLGPSTTDADVRRAAQLIAAKVNEFVDKK